MDELLEMFVIKDCKNCDFVECDYPCCKCDDDLNQFKPVTALLELDRLVKLGRRYDNADEKLADSKMDKYKGDKVK